MVVIPLPSHPPPESTHKPPPSQVCGQPSLLELLRSPWPRRDLQFSLFIYTPSPWLHVTSEWCGRMVAADPRVSGLSPMIQPYSAGGVGGGGGWGASALVISELRSVSGFVMVLQKNVFVYKNL